MSDIIAINRLISTITDTSKYVPKIILKKPSVQSGRNCGIGLISSDVVCPNTAKNKRSNAMTGVIGPIFYFVFACASSRANVCAYIRTCVCVHVFEFQRYFFCVFVSNVANFFFNFAKEEEDGSRCNTIQNEMESYSGKNTISFD